MRIILPLLPDPTDQIVQGEMTVFEGYLKNSFEDGISGIQGKIITASMPSIPVPRALVGEHEWYGLRPRKLGPKVYSGGEVRFEEIGAGPVKVFVEPAQEWLFSIVSLDPVGALCTLRDGAIIGPMEAVNSFIVAFDGMIDDTEKIQLPSRAVVMSGLNGHRVFPKLPESYFMREVVNGTMTESTQRFSITGQTLDSIGAALGGCRVIMLDTTRLVPGGVINPVVDETVSDGGGNYSIVAPRAMTYQLIAYLPGSPDVAGITRNDVITTVI
jgi:hypothetical protein